MGTVTAVVPAGLLAEARTLSGIWPTGVMIGSLAGRAVPVELAVLAPLLESVRADVREVGRVAEPAAVAGSRAGLVPWRVCLDSSGYGGSPADVVGPVEPRGAAAARPDRSIGLLPLGVPAGSRFPVDPGLPAFSGV